MGLSLNNLRNRRDDHVAASVVDNDAESTKHKPSWEQEASGSGSDSDTLSLEARNEKEVQLHPDSITTNALPGQQKAEAAALVWSKTAVYCTYAWYVSLFIENSPASNR